MIAFPYKERLHRLWRGFLSVCFFYLSCSPYHLRRRAREQRKKDKQDRAERERYIELGGPEQYQQPASFGQNPYWTQEIVLGPGPPASHQTKQQKRRLDRLRTVAALNRSDTPDRSRPDSQLEISRVDGIVASREAIPESERWKLHQRDDELLWGSVTHLASAAESIESTSTRSQLAQLNSSQKSQPKYAVARNPPINDMSPPIVCNPAQSETSNMWMLQPPPRAEVMSGHAIATRTRSDTASSVSSRRTGQASLSRQLSKRIIDEKLNRSASLFPHDDSLLSRTAVAGGALTISEVEAGYHLEDGQRSAKRIVKSSDDSQNSDQTVVHLRSSVNGVNDTSNSTDSDSDSERKTLPWLAHDTVNGTDRQDFAFPALQIPNLARSTTIAGSSTTGHRPSTAPRLLQLSTLLGSSDRDYTSPNEEDRALRTTSRPAEVVEESPLSHYEDEPFPTFYKSADLPLTQPRFLRRWTVDF